MIPILYYHSIGDTPLSLPTEIFKRQMEIIKGNGIKTLTLKDLVSRPKNVWEKFVVLTFDDCFVDVFENAVPIMTQHGVVGTFFAVPGYDNLTRWGSAAAHRWSDHKDAQFNIPFRYMGPDERRKLNALGMEIGAHTVTHPNLDSLPETNQYEEIVRSKRTLESELGMVVETFCYPRGRYSPMTTELVREAGFAAACTTRPGYVDGRENISRWEMPRFGVGADFEVFDSILGGEAGRLRLSRRVVRKLNSIHWAR